MRMNKIPEKPRLLGILKDAGFDVPDFLFMSGEDFDQGSACTVSGVPSSPAYVESPFKGSFGTMPPKPPVPDVQISMILFNLFW